MSRQISHAAKYKVLDSAGPNAPWIAMAHGLSQDHRVFDRQVDAFVSNYRIILIDLPGHGMSTDIKSAYGISGEHTPVPGSAYYLPAQTQA
jgi:pimeloyl-ACP methyl ester carboxylesterase